MAFRCLIVDDSPRFREAARALLEREGISVVGVAASGDEGQRKVEELRPEVVLVDIDLGAESGFEVARRLSHVHASAPPLIVLISTHDEREFADLIEESPAVGFVPKAQLSAKAVHRLVAPHLDAADG